MVNFFRIAYVAKNRTYKESPDYKQRLLKYVKKKVREGKFKL